MTTLNKLLKLEFYFLISCLMLLYSCDKNDCDCKPLVK